MDKNAIKTFATWARKELIERVTQRAVLFGITDSKDLNPNDDVVNGNVLTNIQKLQRANLINRISNSSYEQVIEEVAYTWFNRFSALRFMEVNDYLPDHIRVFSDENNEFNPPILSKALELSPKNFDKNKIFEFKEKSDDDGLYQFLIASECNLLSFILPRMFSHSSDSDYTLLLMPDNLLRDGSIIDKLVTSIDESDWKDAVQIIGWLYQFYISEKHTQIVKMNSSSVEFENVPAATQLFTTDWIVKYMVDNSLGKMWMEHNPYSSLKTSLKYLLDKNESDSSNANISSISPQELTFLDPCMGSGHILAYAFDVLFLIYQEYGFSVEDSIASILENNLHGFDIDGRCEQLSYFVLMMKARQYDQRFFEHVVQANVFSPKESVELQQYGSLLQFKLEEIAQDDIDWEAYNLLSQKYAVVCTNPPYLNKFNKDYKKFLQSYYKDFDKDLFCTFIYRNFHFCQENGYCSFMTPFVWMFIKTYLPLRKWILINKQITSLIQLEYSAFKEATVPICTFVIKNINPNEDCKGTFIKLSDFKGGMEIQNNKVLEAVSSPNCNYLFRKSLIPLLNLPGAPLAYWGPDSFFKIYENGKILKENGDTRQGMATSDNARFLRRWYEVNFDKINFSASSTNNALSSKKKWFPYNKGGKYRKWFGNLDYVVNYENDGKEIKEYAISLYKSVTRTIKSISEYYKECISWSKITSSSPSFRFYPTGFIFDVAGCCIFYKDRNEMLYHCGLLNSSLASEILKISSPTLNVEAGQVAQFPIIQDKDNRSEIINLVKQNIQMAKDDWDMFEQSWNFDGHIWCNSQSLFEACKSIQSECNKRFVMLKNNEEKINQLVSNIYQCVDDVDVEIQDKDISVTWIYDEFDSNENPKINSYSLTFTDLIKEFLSFCVGCMFGRFSIEGNSKYITNVNLKDSQLKKVTPDVDNIIPVSDDDYFSDDIVGKLIDLLEKLYGKKSLNDNIEFIGQHLKGTGTSLEKIRNYFINDFYTDHVTKYHKLPIYWMVNSGKKNGFCALFYIHRYQSDLLARIRTDYVHEQQSRYNAQLEDLNEKNHSGHSVGKYSKAISKLKNKQKEIMELEEKIHHLADQMIEIDLDDGVKHNYEIFKDVLAPIK